MIKYPSIEQFRSTIKHVKDRVQYIGKDDDGLAVFNRAAKPPTLSFHGTVKLHGTNSSIVLHPTGHQEVQSRNRKVTDGHFGFVEFTKTFSMFKCLNFRSEKPITVYGEWCGEGIQKGIGIAGLPKMFVIFGIRVGVDEETEWMPHESFQDVFVDVGKMNEFNVYHINQFPTFKMEIDFNNPALVQNNLIALTEEVEKECPVAKYFGVFGIGEGIVYKCIDPDYSGSDYWFKVKGSLHSVSKVKTLAEVDIVKIKAIDEFVDMTVTHNRLLQGIEYLKEMDKEINQKSTGDFLSFIFKDVMKEENDTLEASGFDRKDIGKPIGTRARTWYFEYLDQQEM